MESLFLELLSTIKGGTLSSRERAIYRAKDYSALLTSMDKPIEVLSETAFGVSLSQADLQNLVVSYGKLGAFLHLPKPPYFSVDQEEWKDTTEEFVGNTYQFLESLNARLHTKRR